MKGQLRWIMVSPANLHSTKFSIITITRGRYYRPFCGRRAEWTQLGLHPPLCELKKNYSRHWRPISRSYFAEYLSTKTFLKLFVSGNPSKLKLPRHHKKYLGPKKRNVDPAWTPPPTMQIKKKYSRHWRPISLSYFAEYLSTKTFLKLFVSGNPSNLKLPGHHKKYLGPKKRNVKLLSVHTL
jgi:ABC-type oligopeptide transport system substrate-binding subunit